MDFVGIDFSASAFVVVGLVLGAVVRLVWWLLESLVEGLLGKPTKKDI